MNGWMYQLYGKFMVAKWEIFTIHHIIYKYPERVGNWEKKINRKANNFAFHIRII